MSGADDQAQVPVPAPQPGISTGTAPSQYPWEAHEGAYYEGTGGAVAWYAYPLAKVFTAQVTKGELRKLPVDEGRSKVKVRPPRQTPGDDGTAVRTMAQLSQAMTRIAELEAQLVQGEYVMTQGAATKLAAPAPPDPTPPPSRPAQRASKEEWIEYGVRSGQGSAEALDALSKDQLIEKLS